MTATSAWRSANDLYSAGDGDSTKTNEEHTRYAQFVYFHPFVQCRRSNAGLQAVPRCGGDERDQVIPLLLS
jgi:hypothetical protein